MRGVLSTVTDSAGALQQYLCVGFTLPYCHARLKGSLWGATWLLDGHFACWLPVHVRTSLCSLCLAQCVGCVMFCPVLACCHLV